MSSPTSQTPTPLPSSPPLPPEGAIVDTRLAPPPRTRVRFFRPPRVTVGWIEIYGGIVLALVFAARFIPLARFWPGWGCRFRELTGWPCLSCGMTRSFDWFAQGRFVDALCVNPLGFLLACSGACLALWLVLAPLRPPRVEIVLSPRAQWTLRAFAIAACLLNWAYLLATRALEGA